MDPTDQRSGDAAAATLREFASGQKLFGRYTLIKILGRGGMGVVWLARDEELERDVALKFLPDLIIHDRTVLNELKRETRRNLDLTHKNIVRIYDFVQSDRSACISMEYVDGETLSNLRAEKEQKVFQPNEIAAWTVQLCEALDYAHNHARIIHRDLKPANLMINRKAELKVSDFGIARSLGDSVSRLTMERGRSGTLVYMSPQQLDGQPGNRLDDIYSLGATIYDLLTSKPPFYSGNIDRQIHERTAPSMTERRKELNIEPALVPPIWEETIAACLAKDPARRPQSTAEVAQRLQLGPAATGMTTVPAKSANRQVLLGSGIAALALLALAGWYFGILKRPATPLSNAPPPQAATLPEKSIAVLPFENLSKDEENAFFASGVQDEILSNLAKIADLKVISRTSVMNYKDRAGRNLREIAKALGVAHVVEGSVQRAGGKVRVTAQLIDARSDAHVWADHYDRDLADVFAIQSEIAQQIAGQLRAKLSPDEKAAIDERPTADLKAYALYSEARAIGVWDDQPQKNLLRKVALLEQATERDPKFVLAWCALAKLQTDLADFENRETHLAAAKKAAETAVQLRPDLGQSHLALAYYYQSNAAEHERAYEELSIARRTLPNDAQLLRLLGELDRRRNRWDDSLAELRKAYALDPLNEEIQYHLSVNYQFMRLYAEREKIEDEWAAKQGKNEWSYLAYAENKLDAGDPAAAQSFLAKVPDTFSPTSEIWVTRFNAALYLHDYDAASRVLAAIPAKMAEEMFDGQPPQSSADALLARARGDQQKAQAIYSALREKMTTKWAGPPQRDLDLAKAAELDAGSGRKDQAINEARRAVELRPIAQDSLVGPGRIRTLALVYAWTGESAFAIEQLEIIAKIPAGPSYGELRFDPTWDSLRGDPRFEKMVASLAPK
jgi:serine/threonine protein kinase/Tfp pilus assembly protein PilF